MSYWSQRRAAQRPTQPGDQDDDGVTTARVRTCDWTPVDRNPVVPAEPKRTLRQRAADMEQALWLIPETDPADADSTYPAPARIKARSSW